MSSLGARELARLRDAGFAQLYPDDKIRTTIGAATCGIASGAQAVIDALSELVRSNGLPVVIDAVGCEGACWAEPLMSVQFPGKPRAMYGNVSPESAEAILAAALGGTSQRKPLGLVYKDWCAGFDDWVELAPEGPDAWSDHPFMRRQEKLVSSAWGRIVPWSVEQYCATGGYGALVKALSGSALDIISAVEASGLRGRGGAGFPTGTKWRLAAEALGSPKCLIANGDEGDPGAYMDRALMESAPHQLIEGMVIAAYATGCEHGIIFIRSEYPLASEMLARAIREARSAGILGKDILGSGFSFDVEVVQSAGAYICGEETAMISVLEEKRPDPKKKPPYPSERGLFDKPTLIDNVETFANIPLIIANGPERFRRVGTETSTGTKLFCITGSVLYPGIVEVPFGMTTAELVDDIAVLDDQPERNVVCEQDASEYAIQIGGPSGAIMPIYGSCQILGFDELRESGGMVGSGGVVVLGRQTCIVDTARYCLGFSQRESCGSCSACRIYLALCVRLLDELCAGHGDASTIEELERLCSIIPEKSRCALGKMSVSPLVSSLRFFPHVYEEHLNGICAGLVCKDLIHFEVIEQACPGCMCCLSSCPSGAIKGQFNKPFHIDQEKCTKCWMCISQCPYPALMAMPSAWLDHRKTDESASSTPIAGASAEKDAESSLSDTPVCIYCNRCTQACDATGISALSFIGTGSDRRIAKPTFNGYTPCIECGACLEACPTGFMDLVRPEEASELLRG